MSEERSARLRPNRAVGTVTASMVVVAAAGYVVMIVAARLLDTASNTAFLTFWSLLFFTFGILTGLQNEMVRSVRQEIEGANGTTTTAGTAPPGARVLPVALMLGAALSLTVLALTPWREVLMGAGNGAAVFVVALGALLYAGQCGLNGALAGQGAWHSFAFVNTQEALLRLALVWFVLLTLTDAQLFGAQLATALGAGGWILFALVTRAGRSVVTAKADRSGPALAASALKAMAGGVGNATVLVGFPVLLSLTTPADEYMGAAPFLLALSMTRAPIMMPMTAFQGLVITHFVSKPDQRRRTLGLAVAVILAVTVLGAVLAALVGPWLMVVIFGDGYAVPPLVMAVLTVSAGLIAIQTLTGALLLAQSEQGAYAVGWLVTALVSAVMLVAPGSMETRACWALTVGLVVGIVVHTGALALARPKRR